jgi:hypothetical protein
MTEPADHVGMTETPVGRLMRLHKLNKYEMARDLGCTPQAVYYWCNGERAIGSRFLVKLFEVFEPLERAHGRVLTLRSLMPQGRKRRAKSKPPKLATQD